MNKKKFFLAHFLVALLLAVQAIPALATTGTPTKQTTFKNAVRFEGAVTNAAAVTNSSTVTNSGAVTNSGNVTVGGTLGVTGATTLSSTLAVTGAVTLTTPLTAANIQTGSAKRQLLTWHFAQNVATQTAADGTTYTALLFPGRAGTVKAISWGCITAPVGGTDTLTVKKGTGGNTMLSTASVDATTLTSGAATPATLTATSADLGLTATQGIEVEYVAGTQTTDAVDLSVTVEFEPTDF